MDASSLKDQGKKVVCFQEENLSDIKYENYQVLVGGTVIQTL